jgi:hypothetical protein
MDLLDGSGAVQRPVRDDAIERVTGNGREGKPRPVVADQIKPVLWNARWRVPQQRVAWRAAERHAGGGSIRRTGDRD